ncbi:MAG: DUF3179 domain-containing (seleno)protein [Euzebya sp.]
MSITSYWPALLLVLVVLAAACTARSGDSVGDQTTGSTEGRGATSDDDDAAGTTTTAENGPGTSFPPAPDVPEGPLDADIIAVLDTYIENPAVPDLDSIRLIGASGDQRVLWFLSDIIRFAFDEVTHDTATDAAAALSGLELRSLVNPSWGTLTDNLIAWDLPAFPDYPRYKGAIFTAFEPGWQPFFDDTDSQINWRFTSWGGVRIDDRPLGDPNSCPEGCIPSLDDPELTPADEGDWYPDDAIVFGVQIGDDTVALPKNIMEVHEMVNATIGGRLVAIPYCTLCGAAQVFYTDTDGGGTGQIVMRTSGLLHRSNKVMYDLTTQSVFDTFTGEAISGPLLDQGVTLDQATVVTSRWSDWREAHPDTTIIAQDGGIGRNYPLDPLRGRDDDGPIFPIGDSDGRLPVQEPILGVILPDGTPVAFPVAAALQVIDSGDTVSQDGITLSRDAGGLVADVDGERVASHQAFWFAWSQFHPDTVLWEA